MRLPLRYAAIPILAGAGLYAFMALRPARLPLETVTLRRAPDEAPAMCPWRDPARDMAAFFPGATGYRTDVLILSRLRAEIMRRLGPETPLESNALYIYRVAQGSRPRGVVLVRRTAGEHGAIEVVVGVGRDGRITGARIQRQREPQAVSDVLTSPAWLGAFRRRDAGSAFQLGSDLPDVTPVARPSARAVARAARALLIEFQAGERAGGRAAPAHGPSHEALSPGRGGHRVAAGA